ncbi:transcriptional regulator [Paenibacillus sp. GXUN7292]|uniref:transcriptional regulator n=1 Tax=Paenibacillus sp. GXUN7292 TaxID=3422499 RepID=UPI003D7F1067
MQKQIEQEKNHRRRELLQKGLSHGTVEMLRSIWYPTVGNFDYLYPEWEVRDFNNEYRYLDLAFLPGNMKGDIEIHDYRSHAHDLDTRRFKDLCRRQSLLSLDDWVFFPIAYLSIRDEPEFCKQLILSFIGKFLSFEVDARLNCVEAETVRYARRVLKPFMPNELAVHLRVTDRYARSILRSLVDTNHLVVAGGNIRYRTYQLNVGESLRNLDGANGTKRRYTDQNGRD